MTDMHDDERAKAGLKEAEQIDALTQKMTDVMNPGVVVELDPDEAELLGAIQDDAMSEQDAWESNGDLVDFDGPVFIGNDDTDTEIPDFITVSHGSKEPEVKKALKEGADALFKKLRG